MAAEVEQEHVVTAGVEVAPEARQLVPRTPHPVDEHHEVPAPAGRVIPAAEGDAVGRADLPGGGLGADGVRVDPQRVVVWAGQHLGAEQRNAEVNGPEQSRGAPAQTPEDPEPQAGVAGGRVHARPFGG